MYNSSRICQGFGEGRAGPRGTTGPVAQAGLCPTPSLLRPAVRQRTNLRGGMAILADVGYGHGRSGFCFWINHNPACLEGPPMSRSGRHWRRLRIPILLTPTIATAVVFPLAALRTNRAHIPSPGKAVTGNLLKYQFGSIATVCADVFGQTASRGRCRSRSRRIPTARRTTSGGTCISLRITVLAVGLAPSPSWRA